MKSILLPLVLCLMVLSNGCTHAYYKNPETCAEISYWSTKDVKGLKVEMDGITISLDEAENQVKELVSESLKVLTLKEQRAKEVLQALIGE